MTQLEQWNDTYGIAEQVSFVSGEGNMPIVQIENDLAQATIALQGAHVLGFQVKGEAPLIWMSDDAVFAPDKALRGGVPVCWPWFGPHPSDKTLPAHGVARTGDWQPIASASASDGSTTVSFELLSSETTRQLCTHPLSVRLHVTVGQGLRLALETTNLGDSSFTLGQALHTYFQIGDISQVHIDGLDGCEYIDKVDDGARKQQSGSVAINSETDRIYLGTSHHCDIVDPVMGRKINIDSEGSASTVVWNPWLEVARNMGDLGSDGYLTMLCVETTNTAADVIKLEAGATHRMVATYSTQAL